METLDRKGANIAAGFEIEVKLKGTHGGQDIDWTERRLIVCSRQHAQSVHKAFEARLAQAEDEFSRLNQRGRGQEHFREVKSLERAALAVLEKHHMICFRPISQTQLEMAERKVKPWAMNNVQ